MLEPAIVTLIATILGAALFFGGGFYWRRPLAAMDDFDLDPATGPTGPSGPTNAGPWASELSDPWSTKDLPFAPEPALNLPAPGKLAAQAEHTPQDSSVAVKGELNSSQASLPVEALLSLVAKRTSSSSAFILDERGLPMSQVDDDLGAGALLSTMLAAIQDMSASLSSAHPAQTAQFGQLRMQRLRAVSSSLPTCWLVMAQGDRFASDPEIQGLSTSLRRDLWPSKRSLRVGQSVG